MITPEQAEKVTHSLIESYLNDANPNNVDDVERLLLKLMSMAGLALAATLGTERAISIIQSVAANVEKQAHRARVELIRRH
ncbi:hypothetical protein H7A76_31975 [Pseudomonas sp. MSSRFD41]|uniref:hypothetical protein n=1 Tax=Pseudomonas sp. MSSRFD41 TaxID=1310370 RepID=UPI001639EF55|nr:hypothetical protein [Pseudomonas sp. MSSRFD41]MBC2655528.1 hypothetical protein [Pseudomonas sp. MSSRFD41]MBC2660070.1 hypothetical protein [Pseudomonas sp. MSSRFD41]